MTQNTHNNGASPRDPVAPQESYSLVTSRYPLLSLKSATIPGRISDISLTLAPGKLIGLIGPNGSGKSTLMQVAAGILPAPPPAQILWQNRPLKTIEPLERGRLATWVPQETLFEFGFTVRSVVAQGRFAHNDDNLGIDEALAQLDIARLAHRPVNHLSGGERQRVLLARALVTGAPLQLWDEPLAPLDPYHALKVLELARHLVQKNHSVLLSLHDLRLAYHLDELIILHEGKLVAHGPPHQTLTPELLLQVFGVKHRFTNALLLELP